MDFKMRIWENAETHRISLDDLLEKDYLADTTNAVIPADRGPPGELSYLGLYFELNRRAANRNRITEIDMLPRNKLPDVCVP